MSNNFVNDLRTLILRHLDSGSLEIMTIVKSIKHFLTSKLTSLNQSVCNRFGNNMFTEKLNLILIAI